MNRTTIALVAACLPAGFVLAGAAVGNHAAEFVTVLGIGSATVSLGLYGPKAAIELHQDTVMRGRHRRAAAAVRTRTEPVDEDGRQEYDDLERTGEQPALAEEPPPSAQHAEQAEPDDGLMPMRPRGEYVDPYQYQPDNDATLPPAPVDLPPALVDELAQRGVWHTSTGTAQTYDVPPATAAAAAAADEDLYGRRPWAPAPATTA